MPQPKVGTQSHLDYWLYGIVKVTAGLGNTRSFLRAVQEETIVKLLETEDIEVTKGMSPAQALRLYNRHLDDRGIVDADDIAYHRKGNILHVTLGETCPYRGTCNWLHDDGIPLPCFRAIAMAEFLRLGTQGTFEAKLARFDVPCHITFKRIALEEGANGD